MLYTKRKGVFKEYIPLKVGFGKTEMKDGKITRFDKPVTIVSERYNAAADAAATCKELLALKKKGINTIWPNAPQPYWFYNLCDELGLFVIDQANINAIAPQAAPRATIRVLRTNISNACGTCTTAPATTPASSDSLWAESRATDIICTKPISGSNPWNLRVP